MAGCRRRTRGSRAGPAAARWSKTWARRTARSSTGRAGTAPCLPPGTRPRSAGGRGGLADGDLIEVGRTLLVFRDTIATEAAFADDIDSDQLAPPVDGFATF